MQLVASLQIEQWGVVIRILSSSLSNLVTAAAQVELVSAKVTTLQATDTKGRGTNLYGDDAAAMCPQHITGIFSSNLWQHGG